MVPEPSALIHLAAVIRIVPLLTALETDHILDVSTGPRRPARATRSRRMRSRKVARLEASIEICIPTVSRRRWTKVAYRRRFRRVIGFWWRYIRLRVATWAFRTEWAESCEIQLACYPSHMLSRTIGTELAEAPLVIWALDTTLLRMGVKTLVARGTVSVLGVPPALGHAPEVVLVQELTRIAFLTESAQPVLTNGRESLALAGVCG